MTLYEQMLAEYGDVTGTKNPHAEQEVCQKIVLAGLSRGGFFKYAAFYGGTCLRLFHGLRRFSEDMDFTLTVKRDDIHLENYFTAILEEFSLTGHKVEIEKKDKKLFGRVESAFLKENSEVYNIKFQTRRMVKIKIEMDVDPPLGFTTENKLLLRPYSFTTRCVSLPDLYAGKMHALLYRAWQKRVKGRDWYDFEWYVRNNTPLNLGHLQARIKEFNGDDITEESFREMLHNKIACTDINLVKQDVEHFVDDPRELEIWSTDYFLQLADSIRLV